jgi:opacity protein-like surface antigen
MFKSLAASFIAVAGIGAGSAAFAQQMAPPTIHWHVMGGYSDTVGTTADYLQGGYMVGGGFTLSQGFDDPLDLRFEFSYSNHNATNNLLNIGQQVANTEVDNGTGQFWSGTGNVEYHVPIIYGVRVYGIAGVGAYHERVELNQQVPGGWGYYNCDPFSGYCYGNNALVASQSTTKFGWNAGLGVDFALPYGHSWFVEARYHRISTDTPIELVPIAVGYRF